MGDTLHAKNRELPDVDFRVGRDILAILEGLDLLGLDPDVLAGALVHARAASPQETARLAELGQAAFPGRRP